MTAEAHEKLAKFIASIPFVTTLLITPRLNTEPQILGKFTFFALSTFCLMTYLNIRRVFILKRFWGRLGLIVIMCFLFSTLVNRDNLSEQLFGVYGRNNGLILLISSIFLFFLVVSLENRHIAYFSLISLIICGRLVLLYFYLQYLGLDLFVWNKTYSSPVSTLGNPNFLSAFLTLVLFASFGQFRIEERSRRSVLTLIASTITISIALFIIDSQQGYILVGIGFWIWLIKYWIQKNLKVLIWTWSILTCSFLVAVVLALFSIGPGRLFFNNPSLSLRREYWIAGLSMFNQNIVFGNGMDSYLYNFDANKSEHFVNLHGNYLTSSSAHNIYIDLFQGSGLLAGMMYLVLNLCVAVSAIRKVRHGQASDVFWTMLTVWTLIQAQSLISVQNVTFNAWQWLFSGLLVIGHNEFGKSAKNGYKNKKFAGFKSLKEKLHWTGPAWIVSSIILICLTPLALVQDIRFASAIKTSNGSALIELVNSFPHDTYRTNYTAQALENGKYWLWAIQIARRATVENSRNKEAWHLILQSKLSSDLEKRIAREKIETLNPYWNGK